MARKVRLQYNGQTAYPVTISDAVIDHNTGEKITESLDKKQDILISGENIKTINGQSILGKGDVEIFVDGTELPDLSVYVTDTELDAKNYATQDWVTSKNYLTNHQDISHLAEKSDIPDIKGLVKSEDLPDFNLFAKSEEIPSLEGYATESWVNSEIVKAATSGKVDLTGYATETYVNEKVAGINIPSLDGYAELSDLDNKVDKISGKQLSTEDFTTALKQKLDNLSNYDDTELSNSLQQLQNNLDRLMNGNTTAAINSFNEIISFLNGIEDTQSLQGIIASIQQQINLKQPLIEDLEKIKRGAGLGSTALQEIPSEYITEEELQAMNFATTTQLASKQDIITDLDSIRANARMGSTAVQFIPAEYVTETELLAKDYATKSDVSLKQNIIDDIDSIRTKANKVDTKQDIIQDLVAIRNNSLSGIAALQQIENLSTVATTGNYSDLNGLPSIRIIPCYGNSVNISSASTEITPSITWGEDPSGKVLNAVYTLVIPESSASITPVLQHTVSSPFSWGGELDLIPVQLYNKQTKNWVWATLSVKSAVDKNSSKTVPHIYGISVSSVNAPYPANQNTFNTLSQQGVVDFFGGMPQLHGMVTIQK